MNEHIAKKKRCVGPSDCGSLLEVSRRMTSSGDTLTERIRVCIASACMGWRWVNDPTGPQDPNGPEPDERGYCGLAGKP